MIRELKEKCERFLSGHTIELCDYLADMDCSREAKEAVVEAISNYYISALYVKLFRDLEEFLTEEEKEYYRQRYYNDFDKDWEGIDL